MSDSKYAHFFESEHLQGDLKHRSISGGLITSGTQALLAVIRICSVIVLARILTPEHFGLITMVTALTVFVERFQDLGLADATIQRKVITHEQVSTLFWINLCVCVLFAVVVSSLSPVIAWFYHDSRLILITIAFAFNFVFSGLTIQHQALIRRQMRFGVFAWIMILSTTFGFVVAIVLALRGYGYWALVWKELARYVFFTIGSWLFCSWRPGRPVRNSGVKSMLKFGRDITGFNIIYFLSNNIDSILIGKFCGAIPLGLYSRAQQLVTMPASQLQYPISYVPMPALSRLQNDPIRYQRYFEKMLCIISFAYMPIVIYCSFLAEPIIMLVLGQKWISAVPYFRLLVLSVYVLPLMQTFGLIMTSCGKTKRYFLWGVWIAGVLIICFSIGIHWGAMGVAAAYPIANWINFIFSLFFVFKGTPVGIAQLMHALYKPVVACGIMGVVLAFITYSFGHQSGLPILFLSLGIGMVVYIGTWMILPGGFRFLKEIVSYPLSLVSGNKKPLKNVEP